MKHIGITQLSQGALYSERGYRGLPEGLKVRNHDQPDTQLVVATCGSTLVHLWEHSDLLKLKAAVEKALEVTPKKRSYYSRFTGDGVGEVVECQVGKVVATFDEYKSAEEYVAWKNAQEGK